MQELLMSDLGDDSVGIFGIDLGTTYSAISRVDEFGAVSVIRDDNNNGSETTPSVVYFENDHNIVVGQAAKEAAVSEPDQVVALIKREMANKGWEREFFGETYNPPSISALILSKLKQDAEASTGERVEKVVITVPAYFGQLERAATRQAGEIAGLEVIGIIPEPVAAALQYGIAGDSEPKTILVYDLGGGTFDVSVMSISAGKIEVLVTDGDHFLGGADWDKRLLEHVKSEAVTAFESDDMLDDDGFMQELLRKAEDTKRRLSTKESDTIKLRFGGATADVVLTRDLFEDLTREKLDESLSITQRAIDTLSSLYGDVVIDEVLLVGGSSLMPAVKRSLQERFGWDPKLADPHLAVAKGAAVYAAARMIWNLIESQPPDIGGAADVELDDFSPVSPPSEDQVTKALDELGHDGLMSGKMREAVGTAIVNVLPKAIGVKLVGDAPDEFYVEHLIAANTQLPYAAETFPAATVVANQQGVRIELFEQAGPAPDQAMSSNIPIQDGEGVIDLTGYSLPAGSPIHIDIKADSEGTIHVFALEPTSGRSVPLKVQMALLSDSEVEQSKSTHLKRAITS
jgi:molecular chaperone DnaK